LSRATVTAKAASRVRESPSHESPSHRVTECSRSSTAAERLLLRPEVQAGDCIPTKRECQARSAFRRSGSQSLAGVGEPAAEGRGLPLRVKILRASSFLGSARSLGSLELVAAFALLRSSRILKARESPGKARGRVSGLSRARGAGDRSETFTAERICSRGVQGEPKARAPHSIEWSCGPPRRSDGDASLAASSDSRIAYGLFALRTEHGANDVLTAQRAYDETQRRADCMCCAMLC
jgi:hypothetical protein